MSSLQVIDALRARRQGINRQSSLFGRHNEKSMKMFQDRQD